MSSTNKTANYELSQYIGSDKPTYLVDYNGDMLKIDTGMAANKAQTDATDLVVSGHTTAIEGLQGTVSDQGTAITGLRTDVDGNTGSINTINSLIGNGEPTTTDKTIIGAINEINDDVTNTISPVVAKLTGTQPLLRAANSNITADGVDTWGAIFGKLISAVAARVSQLGADESIRLTKFWIESFGFFDIDEYATFTSTSSVVRLGSGSTIAISGNDVTVNYVKVTDSPALITQVIGNNSVDHISDVPTSGKRAFVYYDIYETI